MNSLPEGQEGITQNGLYNAGLRVTLQWHIAQNVLVFLLYKYTPEGTTPTSLI